MVFYHLVLLRNLSFAHGDDEIDLLLAAYDEVFPLQEAVYEDKLAQYLPSEPLRPIFA